MFTAPFRVVLAPKCVVLSIVVMAFCICLLTSRAVAANVNDPLATVKAGTKQVLDLLKENPGISPSLKQKTRAVVDRYFDFQTIAMRVLGPQWRQQPPEKLKAFTSEFSRLLFDAYIQKIEKYTDEKIMYKLQEKQGDYAVVDAVITGGQVGPIPIVYYLHLKKGIWKVYDVMIEGVGLVTDYRDQINDMLSRSSFDDLLKQLNEKIAPN
ncbi:MAG TPA: hypothetical protein DCP92_04305 [Nitrospiraceae bacterium]|nr:hypothetical protein [Nitrospiraceae bacterium]